MNIKDFIVAYLSVPLSDIGITKVLNDKTINWKLEQLNEWILNVEKINSKISIENKKTIVENNYLIISISKPLHKRIGFICIEEQELVNGFDLEKIDELQNSFALDAIAILLCGDTEKENVNTSVNSVFETIKKNKNIYIVFEPEWTTSILIENMIPFSNQLGTFETEFEYTPFFQIDPDKKSEKLIIHRAEDRLQFLLDSVSTASVLPYNKKNFNGSTLLCSTFLPHFTYSLNAVNRFYKNFGVTDSIRDILIKNIENDKNNWIKSIKKYKRYDIIDRGQLEEYISSPDYYQMQLNKDELKEQINNLIALLSYDNYTLCLTPEAVDIAFEIQRPSIRIRTDRRNRARPRMGRINRIEFVDENICDTFEKEFWNKFRLTESDFKEKTFIKNWLLENIAKCEHNELSKKETSNSYDVFISYNSKDRIKIIDIYEELKRKGIKPWLDIYDTRPGIPWIKTLEAQIDNIKSCAVFFGNNGIGPWEDMEQMSFISQFVKRGASVIPIVLKGIKPEEIAFPPILSMFNMVDMNIANPNPISRIVFGIKGTE